MKFSALATSLLALSLSAGVAWSDTLTYQPTPVDLYDLDHGRAYSWGLDIDFGCDPSLVEITSITLSFDNIRNWNSGSNVLYTRMLDTAADGVTIYYDGSGSGDYFADKGTELVTYTNLPNTPQDIEYSFTAAQIAAFYGYVCEGGDMALTFDPDCHFYNDGITFSVTYGLIPEPGTMILLGIGGIGIIIRRHRRK